MNKNNNKQSKKNNYNSILLEQLGLTKEDVRVMKAIEELGGEAQEYDNELENNMFEELEL